MKKIEFWFSIGSTYTYLSVSRLDQVTKENNINFSWHPFSVRKLMMEMNNIPFTPPEKKVKSDYMWRDIKRRSNDYNLNPKIPAPYPLKEFDLANRIAILGLEEGWCEEYVKLTYKYWFEEGLEAGSDKCLKTIFHKMEISFNETVNRANQEDIENKYVEQTNKARELGIFGSPTFLVDGEIFWGDDRLNDAINWK